MAGSTQPALWTAADSWGHTAAPIPAPLGTDRLLAFGASPAGGTDALGHSVHSDAVATVPASTITFHFMTIFSSKSRRTSAFSRAKALSSILTFGIAVSILAGLSLIAARTEAGVVSDADASMLARRVASRFEVKNKGHRHPSRSVRAR